MSGASETAAGRPGPRSEDQRRPGGDAGAAVFELERVSASRGGHPVLRDVSLRVDGGATAILGPSGSGKSTLLRLLNRLADADAGVVRFRGRDVRDLDPLELRRRVALVPQLPAPLPGTVANNVRAGPALRGRPADVAAALAQAGLDPAYASRDAEQLSVGEQQRLMLARALALDPEVLLLDEPTSALDERARAGVERTIADICEQAETATVIVTHDRDQAGRLARRTIALRGAAAMPEP